ncbi:MAG: hypothetical protein C00003105_02141 [ANME-2 cluster archaeon HR1]|nr:MAG: hypothetical protein C00003105_02141 [ANME-2 cluster archaeon HR1]
MFVSELLLDEDREMPSYLFEFMILFVRVLLLEEARKIPSQFELVVKFSISEFVVYANNTPS